MAIPVPLVHCEHCERRFVLQPESVVEDEVLDAIWLLCRACRGDGSGGGEKFTGDY
ncbi:MAG: hypothetical protein JO117_07785 [Verrucomicrobia bacterium]|nr:hypothetical protein [Verrucomicrobiota bacterium]MBV9657032.1 hypothetical protein [Verrucomicrobiota bacterium]